MDSDTVAILIKIGIFLGIPMLIGFVAQIVDFFNELKRLREKIGKLSEENEKLEKEKKKLTEEYRQNFEHHYETESLLRRENEELQERNEELQEKIEELQEKIENISGVVLTRQRKVEEEKADTQKSIQSLNNTVTILENELMAEEQKNISLSKNIKEIKAIYKREQAQLRYQNGELDRQVRDLRNENERLTKFHSNLTAFPYMAAIMADYETYSLEILAKGLDWGWSERRLDKVKSIREIRKDAREMIERHKEAQYQLAYLLELFPELHDVIECEFSQLPPLRVSDVIEQHDGVRDYLSKEEYEQLSTTERNQLALDRYKSSHKKTNWQIGRDYELYVGYKYSEQGYDIDYFGSYKGLEDLGRDIIAKKDDKVLIIQCKYWSSVKLIHEKHIAQLYGTTISYCIENNLKKSQVKGILVTNIELSEEAKKMADFLKIQYEECYQKEDYPCIKCNINYDSNGKQTKIYHLPFDQKYDETKIDKNGEFFAMTVKEAEDAGFRRAHKWYGMD